MRSAAAKSHHAHHSDWVKAVDKKSGRTYYVNRRTKKTQWTKPEGFVDHAHRAHKKGEGGADKTADPDVPSLENVPLSEVSFPTAEVEGL